jgi:hypothetical protein
MTVNLLGPESHISQVIDKSRHEELILEVIKFVFPGELKLLIQCLPSHHPTFSRINTRKLSVDWHLGWVHTVFSHSHGHYLSTTTRENLTWAREHSTPWKALLAHTFSFFAFLSSFHVIFRDERRKFGKAFTCSVVFLFIREEEIFSLCRCLFCALHLSDAESFQA